MIFFLFSSLCGILQSQEKHNVYPGQSYQNQILFCISSILLISSCSRTNRLICWVWLVSVQELFLQVNVSLCCNWVNFQGGKRQARTEIITWKGKRKKYWGSIIEFKSSKMVVMVSGGGMRDREKVKKQRDKDLSSFALYVTANCKTCLQYKEWIKSKCTSSPQPKRKKSW